MAIITIYNENQCDRPKNISKCMPYFNVRLLTKIRVNIGHD